MRIARVQQRDAGAWLSVIDDDGEEHRLWKPRHREGDPVADEWWISRAAKRRSEKLAADAVRRTEEVELASKWNNAEEWRGMIRAAYELRRDPEVRGLIRDLARLLRDRRAI